MRRPFQGGFLLLAALLYAALTLDCALGFEVLEPAGLRDTMGPAGTPGTLLLRQVDGISVGAGGYPPISATAQRTAAALAGSGTNIDDCVGIARDNPLDPARGKVLFALGSGFVGFNPLCTIAEKEDAAASVGAAALVIVDVRDRVFEAPVVVPGTNVGTGKLPVWVVGREAGMAIVSELLAGTPVTMKMYQDPLQADQLSVLANVYRESNGANWGVPVPELAEMLAVLSTDFGVQSLIFDGRVPYVMCTLSFLTRCDPQGRVVTYSMTGVPINGAIPESIAGFTELEVAHFELANVQAPLPASLGTLRRLRSLAITSNPGLFGSAAPDISGLTNLWELKWESNGLTGDFPDLSAARELRVYDVTDNAFAGPAPQLGPWAARLEVFSIAANRATGELDPAGTLRSAESLTLFAANDNELTGLVPDAFGSFPRLVTLRLHGNRFSGAFPAGLASSASESLKELRLAGAAFSSPLPPITGLSSLVLLDLASCGITGALPAVLPQSVQVLDLSNNSFTEMAPALAWSRLTSLRELNLRGNQIKLDISRVMAHIPLSASPSEGIAVLDLRGNKFHATITAPYAVWDLSLVSSLREAYIGDNPEITGQFLWLARNDAHLSLRVLDVSGCPGLIGPVQDNMSKYPALRTLDIRGTGMAGNVFADGIYASPRGDGVRRDPAEIGPGDVAELQRHARAALDNALASPIAGNVAALDVMTFTVAPAALADAPEEEAKANLASLYDLVSVALPKGIEVVPGSVRFDRERNVWCPTLRGVRPGADDADALTVLADDTLHNRALCFCAEGFVRRPGNTCHRCPANVECTGEAEQLNMIVAPGFFPTPNATRPTAAVRCASTVLSGTPCNPDSAGNFTCRSGYSGRLCSVCESGHFSRNGLCFRCSRLGIAAVGVLVVIVSVIVGVFVVRLIRASRLSETDAAAHERHAREAVEIAEHARTHGGDAVVDKPMRVMTIISSALFYFQTLSLSMDGFDLPTSLAVLKEIYDLSNLSVNALGAGCIVGKLPFRDSFILSWTVPLALLAGIWIIVAPLVAAARNDDTRRAYIRIAATMSLVVVSFVYFPMSIITLGVHKCARDPATGISYLVRDPAVVCDELSAALKWIPVVLFPVAGLLAVFALTAVIFRRRRAQPGAIVADLVPRFAGWFFLGFQDRYYLVPTLFFTRRFIVAAAVSLIDRDSAIRYAIVAIVIIASGSSVMVLRPYRTVAGNRLDSIALTGAATIYVCSFIAANEDFKTADVLIVVVFVVHVLVLATYALAFGRWFRQSLRKSAYAVQPVELVRVAGDEKAAGGAWSEGAAPIKEGLQQKDVSQSPSPK